MGIGVWGVSEFKSCGVWSFGLEKDLCVSNAEKIVGSMAGMLLTSVKLLFASSLYKRKLHCIFRI